MLYFNKKYIKASNQFSQQNNLFQILVKTNYKSQIKCFSDFSMVFRHQQSIQFLNLYNMQFTQIHELNNLIRENRQESRYRSNTKQVEEVPDSQTNTAATLIIKDILSIKQPSLQVAADLELYAMSYYSQLPQISQINTPLVDPTQRIKSKSQLPNVDGINFQQSKLIFSRKKIIQTNSVRMSTLNGRLSSALLTKKKNTFEKKIYKIKVYYFGTTTNKIVEYNSDSLGQTIVKKAICQYLSDKSMDHSLIKSTSVEAYQLFLCGDRSYLHDEDLDSINLKKNIRDLNIDSVVLMKDSNFGQQSQESLAEYVAINTYDRKSIVVINEHGEEILKLNMDNEAIIAIIYQKIQKMGSKYVQDKFYLSSSEQVKQNEEISRDTKINELHNTLFIRMKRYADEAVIPEQRKPSQDVDIQDIQAPMGLAQASMYQQFTVIKINKRGIRQQRILGIDQIKIYNYDRQIRKEDKSVGFFAKMFSNVNTDFGTKTPQRLISDIVGVSQIPNYNILKIQFSNIFSSKSLQFQVQIGTRKRIIQKLRVLTNYHQNKI